MAIAAETARVDLISIDANLYLQYVASDAALESKDLVLKLADGASLLEPKGLGSLLEAADHGGRTADEDLDVVRRLREPFLAGVLVNQGKSQRFSEYSYRNHVSSNIADTARPALRGLIQDIVDAESRVILGERIQILLEKDILLGDVGEDEVHLRLVTSSAALDDGLHNLEHGGNAGPTRNHAEVAHHVGGVDERALGAADLDGLSDMDARQVLGDVACRVRLHKEVEVAGLVIARDGGVGAHNLLARSIGLGDGGADGDVLADGQAEQGGRGRELEPVTEARVY